MVKHGLDFRHGKESYEERMTAKEKGVGVKTR